MTIDNLIKELQKWQKKYGKNAEVFIGDEFGPDFTNGASVLGLYQEKEDFDEDEDDEEDRWEEIDTIVVESCSKKLTEADEDADDKEVEDLAKDPEKLDKQIKELSLKEFNRVLDEIFKDSSLSDLEKVLVAKDLHKLTGRDFTYETIGKILGISKVGVKKVEKRALAKLKEECKKAGLSPADLKDLH